MAAIPRNRRNSAKQTLLHVMLFILSVSPAGEVSLIRSSHTFGVESANIIWFASITRSRPPIPSSTARVPDNPSRVAPASSMDTASAGVRIPPLALTSTRGPTVAHISSTARTEAPPAGWNPVEVLTKSAPASAAARHAEASACSPTMLSNAADSTITFRTIFRPIAARTAATSAANGVEVPGHRGSDVDHHVDLGGSCRHREACLLGLDRRKMLA